MSPLNDFHFDDLLAKSEFLDRIRSIRTSSGISRLFGAGVRPLKPEEIRLLEKQGNRAGDWKTIQVSPGFTPAAVFGNTFHGICVLGSFT